ncbi:MAG: hypothetical protein K1X35_05985 [Caulobacteraceae bacterium]|nr:hypothetical protein [Caulobacteraceae bacterium]
MRSATLALLLCALSSACGPGPSSEPRPAPAAPSPDLARAQLQLRARLGVSPVLSALRHGDDGDKRVLCGRASLGGTETAFVMRGGYLVLPQDASTEQFATLQSYCTRPGPPDA